MTLPDSTTSFGMGADDEGAEFGEALADGVSRVPVTSIFFPVCGDRADSFATSR